MTMSGMCLRTSRREALGGEAFRAAPGLGLRAKVAAGAPLLGVLLAFTAIAAGCEVKSDGINATVLVDAQPQEQVAARPEVGGAVDQSSASDAGGVIDGGAASDAGVGIGEGPADVQPSPPLPTPRDAGRDTAAPVDAPESMDAAADLPVVPTPLDGAGDTRMAPPPPRDGAAADGAAIRGCVSSAGCAQDEVCTTVDGVCNAPPGCTGGIACPAVCYGTCRPRTPRVDAGNDATSGQACGNTVCGPGTSCCNPSCGICVPPGVGCTKQLCVAPPCTKDSDCKSIADYCTGCDCRALHKTQELPVCAGPGVQCFADPCQNRASRCVNSQCMVAPAG